MRTSEAYRKHYVAVIGGSISGSEAASLLALNGFRVVVFEMNKLPYGKIEDGLPNWHFKLRDRQINEIDNKLNHPNIRFVPNTKIGEDINFLELVHNWGFSAIILANGAWKDRKMPIPNIDKFVDKELIYQNSFIYWFNHKHERDYSGKNYFIKNNALILGGGLASLDVAKIVMIEIVKKQLYLKKGIDVDLFTLEKYGIGAILEKNKVSFEELNIGKAKLVYRRTARDMPLKSPKDDSAESIEKAKTVSEKLLNKYKEKYLFEFIPLSIPVSFTEENNRLKGITFQKVVLENGKITPINNDYYYTETTMVISSIGSLPEEIKGLHYEYSALKMKGNGDYHVFGFENVFAIGNAVTGRGNIQESKQHGKQMTERIIEKHLTQDALEIWLTNLNNQIKENINKKMNTIISELSNLEIQPESIIKGILNNTSDIHKKIGFTNYIDWIKNNMPQRLEDILKK